MIGIAQGVYGVLSPARPHQPPGGGPPPPTPADPKHGAKKCNMKRHVRGKGQITLPLFDPLVTPLRPEMSSARNRFLTMLQMIC